MCHVITPWEPPLLWRHTLWRHALWRHTLWRHTLWRHTLWRHTLWRHTLWRHTLWRHMWARSTWWPCGLRFPPWEQLSNTHQTRMECGSTYNAICFDTKILQSDWSICTTWPVYSSLIGYWQKWLTLLLKFIVEPSFFTSWTIRSEKCSRAQVQENKSIYLSIYLSIWKPFWKRVYI